MSRVGKLPIRIGSGVEVKVADGVVHVSGPRGQLEQRVVPSVRVAVEDGAVVVERERNDKKARAMHGLMRSLIQNMVSGVNEGFAKSLEVQGVGYRAEMKGQNLVLQVGFSHPVEMKVPKGLEVAVQQNRITVSGIDKQRVGQFAADVRRVRPPEPYKGKGIRYLGETVRRKVGKSAVGA